MMMIAFITIKSSLVPLIEGLCAQIYFRFEISVERCRGLGVLLLTVLNDNSVTAIKTKVQKLDITLRVARLAATIIDTLWLTRTE